MIENRSILSLSTDISVLINKKESFTVTYIYRSVNDVKAHNEKCDKLKNQMSFFEKLFSRAKKDLKKVEEKIHEYAIVKNNNKTFFYGTQNRNQRARK